MMRQYMSLALLVLTLSVLTSGLWGVLAVEPETAAIAQTEGHVGPNLKVIGGSGESSEQVLPEQALQNIQTILQERDRLRVMRDKIKHEQALALEAAADVNDDEDLQLISKGYEVQLKANTRQIEAVENSLVRKDLSTAIKKLQGDYDNAFKAGNIGGAKDFQADLNALQDIAAKRNERARVGVAKDKILGAGSKDLEAAKQELATFSEETETLNKAYRDATDDSVRANLLNEINSRTVRKLDLEQALDDQQMVYNQQRKLIEQEHKEIEKAKKALARQKKDHADLSRDIVNIDAELAELNSAEAKARFSQMGSDLERLNKIKMLEDDKEGKLKKLKNVEELSDPVKTKESIKRALKLLAGSRTELTKEEEQSFKRLKKAGNKLAGPDKSEFVRLEAIQRRGEELKKLRQNPAVNMAYLQAYSGKRIGVVKRIEDGISALDPNADDYAEGRKSLENARRHAALGKNLSPEDVKGLISPSSASVASAAPTARQHSSTPVKGSDNSSPASSESREASVPSVKPNASPVQSKKTPKEWMSATPAELKARISELAPLQEDKSSFKLDRHAMEERLDQIRPFISNNDDSDSEKRKKKAELQKFADQFEVDENKDEAEELERIRKLNSDDDFQDKVMQRIIKQEEERENERLQASLMKKHAKIKFNRTLGWFKREESLSLDELKKREEASITRRRSVWETITNKPKDEVVTERRQKSQEEQEIARRGPLAVKLKKIAAKHRKNLTQRVGKRWSDYQKGMAAKELKESIALGSSQSSQKLGRIQRLQQAVGAKYGAAKGYAKEKWDGSAPQRGMQKVATGFKKRWEGSTLQSIARFAKSPIASTRKIMADKKAKSEPEKTVEKPPSPPGGKSHRPKSPTKK